MNKSIRVFGPVVAVIVVMFGLPWAASTHADAVSPGEAAPDSVSVSPFEYFPAQFVMDAAESREHIPTF